MLEWAGLQELIDRCDVAGVAAAVRGLDDQERRALAEPLRKYERQLRSDPEWRWREQPSLAVAGAAVLPGASAVAPWLARNTWQWQDDGQRIDPTSAVLDVLRDRRVPWLPDLARRLAARLSRNGRDDRLWLLVTDLVSITGIEPPLTDSYVIHWANDQSWGAGVVGKMRLDPRLAVLVPRLFEIDEVAAQFEPPGSLGGGWLAAFKALAAEGLADRAVLVDSCLAGLQRSGRLGALRGLLAVHDALALELLEVAAHARDYLALLPAAHSTVAGAAQRQLRRLDEAGMLGDAMVREASEAVLLRPQKILVRAQLDWLDKAAARDPGRAGELMLAVATAFSHDAADLQARALRVVLRHRAGLEQDGIGGLAAAAVALPADLRAEAVKALGPAGSAGESAAPGHKSVPILVPPAPERMPPPVGSAEELAAELGALYAGLPDSLDPVSLERVLAGLVAFSYADRPALTAALQPLLARHEWIQPGSRHWVRDYQPPLVGELDLIIGASVVPAKGSASGGLNYPHNWGPRWLPGPHAALKTRMAEIAVGVWEAPRPLMMSTPSTSTGLIDPGELLSRLRRAADEGWEPWPADLMLALLRLPRDPDPATAARAAGLGIPAGIALARRLSLGTTDPPVVAEIRRRHHWSTIGAPRVIRLTGPDPAAVSDMIDMPQFIVTNVGDQLILATVWSAGPGEPSAYDHIEIAGSAGDYCDPCELVGELTEPERWMESGHPAITVGDETGWLSCWPMLLPAHRDVIAAHLVPYMRKAVRDGRGGGVVLPGLAAADGPVGAGMHLALGYGLAAADQGDRAAATDALITLAARGQLGGQAFGEKLGVLIAQGTLPLARVVPGLRELVRAGAQATVWPLVAAVLPQILPPAVGQPPRRTGDLIALGVEVAQVVRPSGVTLPCLDELAARRGSSQLIVQARRLRDALAAARP